MVYVLSCLFSMNKKQQCFCETKKKVPAMKAQLSSEDNYGTRRALGQKYRNFTPGADKVKEKLYYDHVGIKTCVDGDTHVRTEEKAIKARKVFNMITGVRIKKGALALPRVI